MSMDPKVQLTMQRTLPVAGMGTVQDVGEYRTT